MTDPAVKRGSDNPERREGERELRLLHVIRSLSPAAGGPPENLRQLAAGYREVGLTMEVLTQDGPDEPFLARYPFRVHAVGPAKSLYGHDPRLLAWLEEHITEYDGAVVEGLWQYTGHAVWKAARAKGVPYAVFPHGMLDPWFRERYPLKHFRKSIYWRLRQYRVLRDAFRVLFTTTEERELAPRSFSPHTWAPALVPLGTSRPEGDPAAQAESFLERCPAVRGRRFLLFLSRIHEKKGCDLLLEAFAQVAQDAPELDLVIAGPDEQGLKARLIELAVQRGIAERVHWPGMLQGDPKWGAFYASEAFVLPSHQENFGIAIAEAIGCGRPTLISNKINIWEYIVEDGVGFVADDTVEGTEELLRNWIRLRPEERAAMAGRTTACFDHRFSTRNAAEHMRDVFLQARNSKASRAEAPTTAR